MTVSDNTIQAEELGTFSEILGRISAKIGNKLATNIIKIPSRALEYTSNFAKGFEKVLKYMDFTQ